MKRLLPTSLPFGLDPAEATTGGYRCQHSVLALRRVYSAEATFSLVKRCFLRYKTEGELAHEGLLVAVSYRPAGMNPTVAKTQENMLHSVAF